MPSRAKTARKDKATSAVQVHGKLRKPTLMHSLVQSGSFMANARRARRTGGPQEENRSRKRFRTEFAEEGDQGKEGQKVVYAFNNPVFFFLKRNCKTW